MTEIRKIETPDAPKAIGPYSQAICTPPFIFISGQIPIDPVTGRLVEANIHVQINRVLDNLDAILKASSCAFHHVIRYEIFLIDLKDFATVNQECAKRFTQPAMPARQTVQVVRLPLDALVEISCIAIQP